ncbi:hypothetical protein N9M16_01805 [Candidatus Dependentiae bacterium]|nr:hypothetical protein [Candidatus Dependentiae bacterium]
MGKHLFSLNDHVGRHRDAAPTKTQPVVIFTDSLTAMYNAIK